MTIDKYDVHAIITAWCQETSGCEENSFVRDMRQVGIPDLTIAFVISLLQTTCPYCRNGKKGCKCWNDE